MVGFFWRGELEHINMFPILIEYFSYKFKYDQMNQSMEKRTFWEE